MVELQKIESWKHKKFLEEHGFGIYYPNKEKDLEKFENHNLRMQEGLARKECHDLEDRKLKIFLLQKWNFLRDLMFEAKVKRA